MAAAAGALAGVPVSGVGVAIQLRLPEVMAAAYRSPVSMRPAPPLPVEGGGWLHADLGAGGDHAAFERLLRTVPPGAPASQVAQAAQEWRLPVCDYRSRPGRPGQTWWFERGRAARPQAGENDAVRILDLTNMWAGPLATWLLASLGCAVTKVEPAFRPDGLRALDGGGIHPAGRQCDPGNDSAMWNALNAGKEVVDLDLRRPADRDRFVDLAQASDVVIDSFSPRVMPNFGLPLPEGPLYVSVPAFPPGPERHWVAYGAGVHAVAGLGDLGGGTVASPAVSYPDPVGGFTAAVAILAALSARRRGLAVGRVECPLLGSVQPLLSCPPDPDLIGADPSGVGPGLLAAGRALGLFEERPVCRRLLPHPQGLFPTKQNVF